MPPSRPRRGRADEASGLVFNPLRADLFLPTAIGHIDEVGLGNEALQRVLRHLLLSKESKGRDRGFISYVELGINQLGAVYEGLMSYTGFFAEEDLFEVAKGGDSSKGSWVVPTTRADHLDPDDFVKVEDEITGEMRPVRHLVGTFVFRLAGRERQQSASYYTPEVLTRFTVSQALEELFDQDGHRTTAEEILGLTVCEPALGSGAFAIEAVRQLAAEYLKRRQDELAERIDPDAYAYELQKVKAHIALHQVHGVDLNATAVELAEVSLWLDTMVKGLSAPWFGLRLRRGNSLIGARRATYSQSQVKDKSWLTATPTDVPMTELAENIDKGIAFSATSSRIHHFLLPALGWGSATEVPKDVAALAPEAVTALKTWRKSMKTKPTAKQIQRLVGTRGARREAVAVCATTAPYRRGGVQPDDRALGPRDPRAHTGRIARADRGVAGRRERCLSPPATPHGPVVRPVVLAVDGDRDQATDARGMDRRQRGDPGCPPQAKNRWMDTFSGGESSWEGLNAEEQDDLNWNGAQPISAVRRKYLWVSVADRVAARQGYFHWDLDFATEFARGGFDLQVGNPPWVRPHLDDDALLAEGDPWWQLAHKPSEAQRRARRSETLAIPDVKEEYLATVCDVAAVQAFCRSASQYPNLEGLHPNLYRCFMDQVWENLAPSGVAALSIPAPILERRMLGLAFRRLLEAPSQLELH